MYYQLIVKRKRPEEIALKSMVHIEEIGELEGKRSNPCSRTLKRKISKRRRLGRKPGDIRSDFQVLL